MNKTHSVFFKLGVSFAVFFFGLLVADHTLAFFNVPAHYVEAVAHPPNFHQVRQTIDFTYRFDTNSYGLRYREIPAEKPANTRRIFVTGDSYVEGFGVDA